ncbi:MAG TPA: polysaccharide biosynthesis protein, partial [Butyricimonas virosa]|nr:polysaccharide biosynthesis protein [Butyricimonas virosa]
GEKLYEEVLNVKETTLPTVHERIKIAKVREYNYSEVTDAIKALDIALQTKDNFAVVKQMKCIVPEFKSKNSTYESIDFQMEEEGVEHHMEEVLNKIQVAENLEVRE